MNKVILFIANRWLLAIALFSSLFFACILFFQTRETIINDPVIYTGLAHSPVDVKSGIDLYDEQKLIQEFVTSETAMSRIFVGLKNLRDAKPDAIVSVGVLDEKGILVKKVETSVSRVLSNELTGFTIPLRLSANGRYGILLTTSGIEKKKALSVYYEPKINSLPDNVRLFVKTAGNGAGKAVVGHLGFKITLDPTPEVVWSKMIRNTRFFALIIYLLMLAFFVAVAPIKRFIRNNIKEKINLTVSRSFASKSEIFAVLFFGIILAGIVTAPFYFNLNKMDSMGDVQRNLLFRALGRESLLKEGMIAQWDPYSCGGGPLLANIESAHTDPFFLLSLAFGENLGLRLSVTLTLALGFFGMYLLARRFLGVNLFSAILAGAIYSFSGFQMLAFSTGVFAWIPAGLIPLFVYFYLRSLEKNIYLIPAAGMLAWIFMGGGPHMPVFAVILAGLLAIGVAVGFRTWRPPLMLYLILIVAALFSAVKLLPAAELVVIFDAFNRLPSFIAPLSWLPKMFVDRHQDASLTWNYALTGENYRWSEFGSYVGIVPVLLFLLGLPLMARKKIMLIWFFAGFVIFVMVFGFFPWTLIQHVPVLKEIVRNPQRLRSIFFLPFGLLCAYGLNAISKKIFKKIILRKIFVGTIVLFAVGDLLLVGAPNFYNLFNLPWPKLEWQGTFVRLNGGYTDEDTRFYKAGYLNYLANAGTTDLCVPNMAVNRPMMAAGKGTTSKARPYRGEAYFLDSNNNAAIVAVSPTKIIVTTDKVEQDGWLVLNQNYYPGWRTEPEREVGQKNGLVVARVLKGDNQIIFKYLPLSFYTGFWISLVSMLIAGVAVIRRLMNQK